MNARDTRNTVLVLDDEPQVLTAIEDTLEDEFRVLVQSSPRLAIRVLENEPRLAVIMSDQRMPGMTGDEFLARARQISDASRIMITGYADLEAVVRAVNNGKIFSYISKPWDPEQLKLVTYKAVEHYALLRELQHERDLLRNLMDNVPEEIHFKGLDHRYIRVNWAAARGEGIESPASALGRLDSDFISDPARVRAIHEEDRRVTETKRPLEVDEVRTAADGTATWVARTKAPVLDPAGNVASIVAIVRDITARKQMEQRLAEREENLRLLLESTAEAIFGIDSQGRCTFANPACARMLGHASPGDLVGKNMHRLMHHTRPDGGAYPVSECPIDQTSRGGSGVRLDNEMFWRADRSSFPVEYTAYPILRDGEAVGAVVAFMDISERIAKDRRIARLTRMHAMLSGINSTIVRVRSRDDLFKETCRVAVETGGFKRVCIRMPDGSGTALTPVASVGPESLEIAPVGLDLAETSDARATTAVRAFVERRLQICNDLDADSLPSALKEEVRLGIHSVASLPLVVDDKAVGAITLAAAEVNFFDEEEIRLIEELAADVSFALDTLKKGEQLYHLAVHDPLTGLANRAMFLEQIGGHIASMRERNGQFAVAAVNLMRFRTINESLGLHVGDQVLKHVAARLVAAAGRERVARLSADVFGVIVEEAKDAKEASRRVRALAEALAPVYELEGRQLHVRTRFGVALYPADGDTPEALGTHAEAALHKDRGALEAVTFYAPEMNARVADQLEIENRLRGALDERQFVLFYQPKLDTVSGAIVGAEALIRWNDPREGLIAPGRFIPVLEETGMIVEAGAWALEEAARMQARLRLQGLACPRIAVNVSQVQMRRAEFVREVIGAVQRGAAEKHDLNLEITESLLAEDIDEAVRKLKQLREAGFGIAVDDFGTGYSSLGYLARLPIDALKIDRSFVVAMHRDANSMAIVSTIINLAHSFQLKVVAEGVDSEDQLKLLRLLRCDEIQGYLFHKPLPEAEFAALLARQPAQDR